MIVKRFSKKRENFTCEKCKYVVIGSGYTDHCPNCLYGKHVDVNPGDRQEKCGGEMVPKYTIHDRGGFIIYYRCAKCGIERRFKAAADDNQELLEKLLQ